MTTRFLSNVFLCASARLAFRLSFNLFSFRLKPLPGHFSPHLAVFPHREERLEPPPHGSLPIPEVLEHGIREQSRQVADPPIASEVHYFEHDGPKYEHHAVAPRDEN